MKSYVWKCFAVCLYAGVALAADAATTPLAFVQSTTDQLLARLKADRPKLEKEPGKIYDLVGDLVLPHFDFEAMARSVLGKHWRRAKPDQQKRFVEEFRVLLVRTYASSLLEYSDEKIRYLPVRESSGDTVKVRTEIDQKSGFPVPVDYDLKRDGASWKVVDVTIDGLDLVVNYRTSFGKEIRQIGLDGTIDKLAKKNQEAGR